MLARYLDLPNQHLETVMSHDFSKHPVLTNFSEMKKICDPLKKLNISYFAYVEFDNEKNFRVLGNNHPEFFNVYFEKEYFAVDIHTVNSALLGNVVVWDCLSRGGKTLAMNDDAMQLGVRHTFTIIENNFNKTSYFHFSIDHENEFINQFYLANIPLLKSFIKYFQNEINNSSHLNKVHDFKINLKENADCFTMANDPLLTFDKAGFLSLIQAKDSPINILTKREMECLKVCSQGKTAKEVAYVLGISSRTVEKHLIAAKQKFAANTKSQLISHFLNYSIQA